MTSSTLFEDRFVAFVDILGFREIVAGMKRDPSRAQFIRDVLKTVQKQERRISRERRNLHRMEQRRHPHRGSLHSPSGTEMTAFSDCYVFSGKSESGWEVLAAVQALAALMLYKGILVRGGVVRGKAYHDGRVIFGPAVIGAYELELTAKYPRILVEDHIVRSLWWLYAEDQLFLRDFDGSWFVNPFRRGVSQWSALLPELKANQAERDFLTSVRRHLVRLLSAEMRSRKRSWDRIAKLRWLSARFNDALASKPIPQIAPIDLDRPRMPKQP